MKPTTEIHHPDSGFAFPKEPGKIASNAQGANTRMNQLRVAAQAEREAAWQRIRAAAKRYNATEEERRFVRGNSAK